MTTLRDEIIPATLGSLEDVEYGVAGGTAVDIDSRESFRSPPDRVRVRARLRVPLLLVSFRSVVIAAKAVILNLLSVAAAYGILVLVFQHGWGKGLIGVHYTEGSSRSCPSSCS